MASKEEILDGMRALLAGRQRDEVQPREFAGRIAERSVALKRRIDCAVAYARRGLKLEACSAADEEPSVFDEAALFESPEMKAWKAFCAKHRLPEPDPIPFALVQELDEAVAQTKEMRRVLARMRRLVLEDAPSWERLEVLRDLIRRDPGNPAWARDRADLEPVAVAELADRFDRELADGRLDEAESRVLFLEDGAWSGSGAAKAAGELRKRLDVARCGRLVEELSEVLRLVETERAAESVPGVRSGVDSIRALEKRLATHHGEVPAAIRERASEVERWLLDRESMAAAIQENEDRVGDLERVLADDAATLPKLRSALRSAEQTVDGVPEPLAAAVGRRIDSLERQRRIRRAAVVAGIAALVIASVIGSVLSLRSNARKLRIEQAAATVEASVAAGRLDEAASRLAEAEADPDLAPHPRIAEARGRLDAALAEIRSRAGRFSDLMAEAGEPGAEQSLPDRVEEASKFAATEQDVARVREWQRRHAQALGEARARREQEGLRRVGVVRSEIAAATPTADLSWGGRLGKWQADLDNLKGEFGDLPSVTAAADGARRLVEEVREKVQLAQKEASRVQRLDSLGAAAGGIDSLVAAIEGFRREFPDAGEAAEMASALGALPAWRALDAWSAIDPRPTAALADARQRDRSAVMASVRRFRDAHPNMPSELDGQCRTVVGMLSSIPEWRDAVSSRLSHPEFGYWWIETIDGSRRYATVNPETIPWQKGPDGTQEKSLQVIERSLPKLEEPFARFEKSMVRRQGASPQMVLAESVRKILDGSDAAPNDFDGVFDVLELILAAEAVDGKLAASLAKVVVSKLETALPEPLTAKVEAAREQLVRLGVDASDAGWDWTRPSDQRARERSVAAWKVLRSFVKPSEWRAEYRDRLASASKAFAVRYRIAGVVRRVDAKPTLLVDPARKVPPGSELLAVDPGVAGEQPRLSVVGRFDGETTELGGVAGSLPTGSVIFFAEGR